jgi:hypothetical protein
LGAKLLTLDQYAKLSMKGEVNMNVRRRTPNPEKKRDYTVITAIISATAIIAAALIAILPDLLNRTTTPTPIQNTPLATVESTATDTLSSDLTNPTSTLGIERSSTDVLTSTATTSPTFTSEPTSSTTFTATFDNPADWPDLPPQARISQGKLLVTVRNNESIWVTMPFKASQNFTLQAEATYLTGHGCYTRMGFALGQKDAIHHSFLLKGSDCDSRAGGNVGFYENNAKIFTTKLGFSTMETNQARIVRLEAKDGIYTLYVDGQLADYIDGITPYGDDIGLFAWYAAQINPVEATFTFDNLILMNQ